MGYEILFSQLSHLPLVYQLVRSQVPQGLRRLTIKGVHGSSLDKCHNATLASFCDFKGQLVRPLHDEQCGQVTVTRYCLWG